jgi:hypothetical protein
VSLVGFRAQNHPQQRVKDVVDDRAITTADFAPLYERFRFTIDAAASATNARLERYWTIDDDALKQPWARRWLMKNGEQCQCPCHLFSAPAVALGDSDAISPVDPRRRTGSTATAVPAPESEHAGSKPRVERTPSNAAGCWPRRSGTAHPPPVANGSGSKAAVTTTGVGSGETPSRSIGAASSGPSAAKRGASSARTASAVALSNKTTSFPLQQTTALELFPGTWCRPVEAATGAREVDGQRPGSHSLSTPRSTTPCCECETCTASAERVYANPPYSNIRPWVEKAWSEVTDGCELVVMLLPANRCEQRWWQDLIEPYRDGRSHFDLTVEFLPGRMRFERPGAVIGPKGDRPPFGCCLVIWGQP